MSKKIAAVTFPSNAFSKRYHFLTDIGNLQFSDYVVVDTANGLQIAQFESYVESTTCSGPLKWIVQHIDLVAHNDRKIKEEQLAKLKKEMEKKKKELEEVHIFALLADKDPEMKKLFDSYMQLNNDLR